MNVTDHIRVDRTGFELAGLFAVVAVLSVVVSIPLQETAQAVTPPEQFGSGTGGEASAGVTWAIAEVAFAAVLLGVIYLIGRLSDWVGTLLRRNGVILLLLFVGSAATPDTGPFMAQIAALWLITGGVYSLYFVTDRLGVWWVVNNLLTIAFAVLGGVMLGMLFGSVGLVLAMIILTAYDHYFANENEYMFELGATITRYRMPVLFIRPGTLRFRWQNVVEQFDAAQSDEEINDLGTWGIGTADMMLPAGIISAVVSSNGPVFSLFGFAGVALLMVGVFVACFRLRHEMTTKGSGAGLPALAAGVITPYLLLAAVAVVV